jgi:hypothetical protein
MSIFNITIENFDFKQIAETTSTIRAVGTGFGLLGISVSYFGLFKREDDPQCMGLNKTACDIFRFIYYF